MDDQPLHSTTLVAMATNVHFDKTQLTKIAMMANCGAARAINPYHTTGDGDQRQRDRRRDTLHPPPGLVPLRYRATIILRELAGIEPARCRLHLFPLQPKHLVAWPPKAGPSP